MDQLEVALEEIGLQIHTHQVAKLERYCQLLWTWNEQINLTRHTTYPKFAARDVLDSWELSQLLRPDERVLDVGSGGGVPGIPVAILRPDLDITLSESVQKKARALSDMIQRLELACGVHNGRAELLLTEKRFNTVMARGVGSLEKILGWFKTCWKSIGRILLVKGPKWIDERNLARHHGLLRKLELRCLRKYSMPGTDSQSVILEITQRR